MFESDYCFSIAPHLRWKDLKYGLEHGYLSVVGVVDYALDSLAQDSPSLHYELASYSSPQKVDVSATLDKLSLEFDSHDIEGTASSKEVWLFLILYWLYINREDCADAFGAIESVYADFDYPEEVAPIVRYMPSKDDSLVGDSALIDNWKNLIEKLKLRLASILSHHNYQG